MSDRRWTPDMEFEVDGIRFRTARGYKHDDDIRLDHLGSDGKWRATSMTLGFMMADFWFENEEAMAVLYPQVVNEGRFRGGRMYLERVATSTRQGWEAARATLDTEKERANGRHLNAVPSCPHSNIYANDVGRWFCADCGSEVAI